MGFSQRFVPPSVGLSVALSLAQCGPTVEVRGQSIRVESAGNLLEAAAAAKNKACSIKDENLSGRGDEAACGPFPCDAGKCVVATCKDAEHCYPGFCSEGYCVRAKEQGSRACEKFVRPESDESAGWQRWAGCRCTPQSEMVGRDAERCGQFPCTRDGCYVHECRADRDCAVGVCAEHIASPHGYCVTDDAI